MKIVESMLTENSCYKLGRKMRVQGLMLHSIGTPQPRAEVFARRWNDPYKEVAVHGFIDGNTGEVWQFLPWEICGWHAGGGANLTHIGVEMGEPDSIRYKPNSATFTVSEADKPGAIETVKRTYASAVELFAYLCREFDLDPLADGVIIGHADGHARGIASNHGDPEHIWRQLGLPYTMDSFRRDVAAKVTGEVPAAPAYKTYTVQRGDTLSGIGVEFGVDWHELAELNYITNPSLIYPGQVIKIPTAPAPEQPEQPEQPETPEEPQTPELPPLPTYLTHTVQKGETLSGIGVKYGVEWRELAQLNSLADPSLIYPGQVIKISEAPLPTALTHTVQPGDSLWKLAKQYLGSGIRYTEIMKLNGLKSATINPGDTLTIPKK